LLLVDHGTIGQVWLLASECIDDGANVEVGYIVSSSSQRVTVGLNQLGQKYKFRRGEYYVRF
jgi:hypothetical protein